MANLSDIQHALAPHLDALNAIIEQTLHSDTPLMNDIVANYLRTKGKQLRPLLVLLAGRLFGGVNERVLHAGAAIEMLHNASLIHDDVIDQAQNRRSVPTINSVWDNHVAVLVGDFFVTGALRCAVKTGNTTILEALATMGGDLSLGEINQIDNARLHNINEQDYLTTINKKTASLFECCVAVGGLANDAPADDLDALKRYARLMGICFQIKDDIFDYFDDCAVGKPTGNDLREGKVTLPLIHALSQSQHPQHAAMVALASSQQLSAQEIATLVAFAKENGGIDYAYATMKRLKQQADDILGRFPHSETTEMLRSIFDFIIERNN